MIYFACLFTFLIIERAIVAVITRIRVLEAKSKHQSETGFQIISCSNPKQVNIGRDVCDGKRDRNRKALTAWVHGERYLMNASLLYDFDITINQIECSFIYNCDEWSYYNIVHPYICNNPHLMDNVASHSRNLFCRK